MFKIALEQIRRNWILIEKFLREADPMETGKVPTHEFKRILRSFGIRLREEDFKELCNDISADLGANVNCKVFE